MRKSWDVRHGRIGELPARLRAARSDGALLHARHRGKGDDDGNGAVGGRCGNDWRLGVGGRVLETRDLVGCVSFEVPNNLYVGWGLEREGHNHALGAHGCGRLRPVVWHY